jgi:DNA-binding transcriptional ArsR family regulator
VLQQTAATFGMLSGTVRLHLVWLLAGGERDVGTLADEVGQSVATVSHHLGKLKLAGLVRPRREGKRHVYLVDDPHVVQIVRRAVEHHRELAEAPRRHRSRGA